MARVKTVLSVTDYIEFLLYIFEARKTKLSFKPVFQKKNDYHLSIAYVAYSTKQY